MEPEEYLNGNKFLNPPYKNNKLKNSNLYNVKMNVNNEEHFVFQGGKVTEVIPVDYQLAYYGCPILDVLYFIYSATDYDFRKKHLNYLKDLYYESLKAFLGYFKIPHETVFPREEFERQFTEKRDYGLMVNVFLLPFLFVSENKAPDLTKNKIANLNMELDDKFKDRFNGAVQEFIDLGYL